MRKVVQSYKSLGSGFSSKVSDELKLIDEGSKSDNKTMVEQLGQLTVMCSFIAFLRDISADEIFPNLCNFDTSTVLHTT